MATQTSSVYFFFSNFYKLLIGANLLLLAQLVVFAIIGLAMKQKLFLMYGLLIYWILEFISFVLNYHHIYVLASGQTVGQYVMHFLVYYYLEGLLFILVAVIFSIYGQRIKILQNQRENVNRLGTKSKIGLVLLVNILVVFILGRII